MAKLENTTVKKPKGKKRKHTNTETEDEVANKSVIVEANVEEDEPMQTNTETEQGMNGMLNVIFILNLIIYIMFSYQQLQRRLKNVRIKRKETFRKNAANHNKMRQTMSQPMKTTRWLMICMNPHWRS